MKCLLSLLKFVVEYIVTGIVVGGGVCFVFLVNFIFCEVGIYDDNWVMRMLYASLTSLGLTVILSILTIYYYKFSDINELDDYIWSVVFLFSFGVGSLSIGFFCGFISYKVGACNDLDSCVTYGVVICIVFLSCVTACLGIINRRRNRNRLVALENYRHTLVENSNEHLL